MRFIWAAIVAIVAVGAWEIGAPYLKSPVAAQSAPQPVPVPALSRQPDAVTQVPQDRAQIGLSFAPVVAQTAPAVVSIYARRIVESRANPLFSDPLFGQLFGDRGRQAPRVQNALGSGVILSADGIVVSNNHVVGGADDIRVVLGDRREYAADVVLADAESDLAVLRLRGASDLPFISLANSDNAQVGDLVLAIGNPFGVGQTVSSGIVSALARSGLAVGSGRGYFIQTDAPINPGNSGGALVDMAGRLVGINTAILTRSGGSNGIGFAIPANLVQQVVGQAQEGRARFQRPWLGLSAQAVDAALAEAFGQTLPQGVVITALHPQSPLVQAGLRRGDVILAVDDAPVNSQQEVNFRLASRGIGANASLTYQRGERREQASVPLISAPESPARERLVVQGLALRGLVAETINPAVIAENALDPGASGVLVVELRDISARTGLTAGDVIVAVNRQRIRATSDLDNALRDPSRYWEIEILRDGRRRLLRFRL